MGYSDWNGEEDITAEERSSVLTGTFDTIPVIDISGIYSPHLSERQKTASLIRDACTRVGFFYIENHGIPDELVDGAFEWGRRFFDLPFEEKMEVYIDNSPNYRGFTPLYGCGKPNSEGKGNANEAFDFGHDRKLNDDPNDKCEDPYMKGDNPWPRSMSGFEEHLSRYYRVMRDFCRVMARCMALSLGLPEDYFAKYITHPGCSMLVAHYPSQEVGAKSRGLDAHTDAEFFTILAPGDVRALEVANRAGTWISAPPRPGCFIVNVGDQLQAMTNDLYVSTKHRVMNYSGQERYSIPFFFSANWETVIEPIPELMRDGHVAKHSPLPAGKMYKDTMIALHRIAASNPELLKYRKPIAGTVG